MEEKLISVIIPVFNVERYLATCIDSIINQDYNNLEIILINDGSSDFSYNIAEKYREKDDRVKLYTMQNEGPAEARNIGLSVSTGDFVTFVDSDDILLPEALTMMMRVMKETEADIVEGKTIKGNTHGEIKYKNFYPTHIYSPYQAIENVLYQKKLLPSVCGKLFKKNLFDDLKFEKSTLYEDLDFFYRIFEKARLIAFTEFPVYFYRRTDGSIINTWKPQRLDVLKVTEKIENHFKENNPDLFRAAKDRRLSANFNMYCLTSLHGDNESAQKCWEIIKQNRISSLLNPNVRFKNKAGILLSFLGKQMFGFVSKRIYKK